MKIITINMWGNCGPYEERWKFFLSELISSNPDIVCLQEVCDSVLTKRITESLRHSHFVPVYKSGLLLTSRFPILSNQIIQYRAQSPTEEQERRAIIAILKIGLKNVCIANTHLSWKSEDETIRQKQVRELIRAVNKVGLPSLLSGDFNDRYGSKPIKEITKNGYLSLSGLCHPNEENYTWDNRNPFIQTHSVKFPDRQVDFLFADKKFLELFALQKSEIVFNRPNDRGIYPSDHYGVFAEFQS